MTSSWEHWRLLAGPRLSSASPGPCRPTLPKWLFLPPPPADSCFLSLDMGSPSHGLSPRRGAEARGPLQAEREAPPAEGRSKPGTHRGSVCTRLSFLPTRPPLFASGRSLAPTEGRQHLPCPLEDSGPIGATSQGGGPRNFLWRFSDRNSKPRHDPKLGGLWTGRGTHLQPACPPTPPVPSPPAACPPVLPRPRPNSTVSITITNMSPWPA